MGATIDMYGGKFAYFGRAAEEYEARRLGRLQWRQEHRVIDKLLDTAASGDTVLDVPCGTGRLFPIFRKHSLRYAGADISPAMVDQVPSEYTDGSDFQGFTISEVERLPFEDKSFDHVVSLRFLHFRLPHSTGVTTMTQLCRVARKSVVVQVRIADRKLFGRVADRLAEIVDARARAPVEVTISCWRMLRRVQQTAGWMLRRLGRRHAPLAVFTGDEIPDEPMERSFAPTESGFTEMVDSLGFTVAESYGSVSRWSSVRIYSLRPKGAPRS